MYLFVQQAQGNGLSSAAIGTCVFRVCQPDKPPCARPAQTPGLGLESMVGYAVIGCWYGRVPTYSKRFHACDHMNQLDGALNAWASWTSKISAVSHALCCYSRLQAPQMTPCLGLRVQVLWTKHTVLDRVRAPPALSTTTGSHISYFIKFDLRFH